MSDNDRSKDSMYWMRILKFPANAKEALKSIESMYSRPGKQVDLQMRIISDFVFGDIEDHKSLKKPYSMMELQLIEVLSEFFQSPGGNPADRNALFLSLFPVEKPSRLKFLGQFVSMAISTENKAVLNATGMWLQQLGSTSSQSVGLAKHILNDYLVLTLKSIDKLKQLPILAPHFTANLLTAIGEVYKDNSPPVELLRLIGDWISENPSLLLTSLTDNPALPTGGIPMTPITPIAGLFRWCILSPFWLDPLKPEQWGQQQYYSKVQQLLMDSVLRLKSNGNNKHAISAQHFANTTRILSPMLQSQNHNTKAQELAVERMAQAISSAMSANCIYGNKQELLALLQPLSYRHFLIEWTLQNYATKTS